jgi:N-acetylmuramoyl-L-alanine amidase
VACAADAGGLMKIVNHRLVNDDGNPFPFRESPNHAGLLRPEILVMHFTAGRSADSSVTWLTNPAAKASAHVVIGEDGKIVQLVPLNMIAWHAGKSAYNNRVRVNEFSIGIEIANPGELHRTGSKWRTWFGGVVPDDEVIIAKHKHGGPEMGWKVYTSEQLTVAIDLGVLLVQTYQLKDVVGHEDVAPGRKVDPGPAFPMERYRGTLLGRADDSLV